MAKAYFNFKPFDYEKILENYIQLVGDAEGVDFLGETYKPKETVLDLNEKETAELYRIALKLRSYDKMRRG